MQYLTDQIIKDSVIEGSGTISEVSKILLYKLAEKDGLSNDEFEAHLTDKLREFFSQEAIRKKFELQKCPNCGSNVPLLSKVCDFCKTVLKTPKRKGIRKETLIKNIKENIDHLNKIPKQNFFRSFMGHWYFIMPILIAFCLFFYFRFRGSMVSDIPEITFAIIIAVLTGATALLAIVTYRKRHIPKEKPGKYLAEYEKYSRMANAYYGTDGKIKVILCEFRDKIGRFNSIRKKVRDYRILGYILVFCTLSLLGFFFYPLSEQSEIYELWTQNSKELYDFQLELQPSQTDIKGPVGDYMKLTVSKYYLRIDMGDYSTSHSWVSDIKLTLNDSLVNLPNQNFTIDLVLEDENHKALYGTHTLINSAAFSDKLRSGMKIIFTNFIKDLETYSTNDKLNELKKISNKAMYFHLSSVKTR